MAIYTVKTGDSLYSIASRYGTTAARIASDNGIANPAVLSVGQALFITEPEKTYTVRPGDTLDSIAEKNGVSLLDLWRNNPYLKGMSDINPGDTIFITLPSAEYPNEIEVSGYAYPFMSNSLLRSVLPYLTYLPVFTYGINNDYSLIPIDDRELIETAREYAAVPIMMVASLNENGLFSNELAAEVLSSDERMDSLSDSIAEYVRQRGYGGVEFDFEYIRAEYADAYAALIAMTRDKIYPLPVFADLAPKESDGKAGLLYEGHSYSDIGQSSDRNLLMTYEYGYTYGPPMAVAPVNSVENVIKYAVTRIPPEKLLLGVPNYAYDWPLPYVNGTTKATSLSNIAATELASVKGAEIRFDTNAEAPYFYYFDRTTSGPVRHEVWFENPRSYRASFGLINKYNLAGTGIWNILRGNPSLWLVLNSLYKIKKIGG